MRAVFRRAEPQCEATRKRLDRGTFKRMKGTGALQIDSGALALIMEGLDAEVVKRPTRWRPKGA